MINLEKMKYELSATPPLPLTPPPCSLFLKCLVVLRKECV